MNGIVAASLVAPRAPRSHRCLGPGRSHGARDAARASGAAGLTSIQITGTGMSYPAGQAPAPGLPWPKFNVKTLTRDVNYATATLRDDYVRTQAEDPPRGGGVQPIRAKRGRPWW